MAPNDWIIMSFQSEGISAGYIATSRCKGILQKSIYEPRHEISIGICAV